MLNFGKLGENLFRLLRRKTQNGEQKLAKNKKS